MRCLNRKPLITAGELTHEIAIQQPTDGDPSESGECTKSWSTVLNCWAKIDPTWGREYERAMQQCPEMTLLLTIRYSPDVTVTSAMRVMFGSRYLHIVSVRNIEERNEAVQLMCKEEG